MSNRVFLLNKNQGTITEYTIGSRIYWKLETRVKKTGNKIRYGEELDECELTFKSYVVLKEKGDDREYILWWDDPVDKRKEAKSNALNKIVEINKEILNQSLTRC